MVRLQSRPRPLVLLEHVSTMLPASSVCRSLSNLYLRLPCRPVSSRQLTTQLTHLSPDFAFYPNFFTVDEQCILLRASLKKLDAMESGKFRRRRRQFLRNSPSQPSANPVQALFLPDDFYDFQEVCPLYGPLLIILTHDAL